MNGSTCELYPLTAANEINTADAHGTQQQAYTQKSGKIFVFIVN
jgi:hypothetical protein